MKPPDLGAGDEERRRAIVRELLAVVRADFGALFDVRRVDGVDVYGRVIGEGNRDACDVWENVRDLRHDGPWDPASPGRWANRFSSGLEGDLERRMLDGELSTWVKHYHPVGLRWQRRALIYDGSRFVGWLGLLRTRDRPDFGRSDDAALARALPRLGASVRADARLRDEAGFGRAASIVARPDGSIDLASPDVEGWLSASRREALAGWTRRVDREGAPVLVVVDDALASWVRLSGGDGRSRILWMLQRAPRPTAGPLSTLSRRQREIAEYAAAGATLEEIASHLALSVETVRTHLKAAYRQLGVSTRLELRGVLSAPE
jgi:DNA-binding CsgD family transcriptional regulator